MKKYYEVKTFGEKKSEVNIYFGFDLIKAVKVFDEYYANNPHSEMIIVDTFGNEIKSANVEKEDDDDGYDNCWGCNGSGEGMWDGSNCSVCGGSGALKTKDN